jgi:hypothetical protein
MKRWIFLQLMLLASAGILLAQNNVGIGTAAPLMRLHVLKNDSALMLLQNTQTLADNVSAAVYFKIGDRYTGALKTIGDGSAQARIGIFSYAAFGANELIERVSILDNGRVGIGITNPVNQLEVNGRVLIRYYAGASAGIWYNKTDNTAGPFVGNYNDSIFGIFNNDGGSWQFYFDHKNARLGMNLANPKVALSFPAATGKKISLYPGTNGDVGFDVWGNELRIHSDYSGADITFGYDTYPNTFVERMRVKGSGAVCIGTTDVAAGYLLNVGGKAIAEEMRVQLRAAWPDYVFDEDYQLPQLQDVASFIAENKHLPGIPKASEIQKGGILLGEMQTKMMEKIEQLTLYIIRQQGELDALKQHNALLSDKVKTLEKLGK